jgi:ABC-type multidrug transport system fused ATPase/permease subunit
MILSISLRLSFLGLMSFTMQLFVYLAAYAASRTLHSSILYGVLRAPMSFFDTTPIGRVINRFAKDVDSIDSSLPSSFSSSFGTLTQVLITMIILIYGSWFAIFALIPLAILFAYIQVFQRKRFMMINKIKFVLAYLCVIFKTTSTS